MTLHKGFGKILRPLQHCSGLGRPDDRNTAQMLIVLKVVVNTLDQRIFRAHDNHTNLMVDYKTTDGVKIIGFDGHILPHLGRTGIAGSNVEMFDFGTLCNFPGQCVFAAARSEE